MVLRAGEEGILGYGIKLGQDLETVIGKAFLAAPSSSYSSSSGRVSVNLTIEIDWGAIREVFSKKSKERHFS